MRKKQNSSSPRNSRANTRPRVKTASPPVKAPYLVAAVVERGKHDKILRLFYGYGIFFTAVCMGQGTAGSEIMDILGLENSEKDVVLGFASPQSAAAVMGAFNDRLAGSPGSKGIAFCLKLNAVPGLLLKAAELKSAKCVSEDKNMEDTQNYCLILISVNQGYTDEVMASAKKAGARGGTVIRARQISNEETDSLFGAAFTPEREIIAIITTREKRNAVMESVNADHGVRSESGAVVLSLPVDEIAKLS